MESQEGRVPPQNIEAEQSVLGSLMLDKNAMTSVADILQSDDFYRGTHADIYQAMLDLYEKSEPIDLVSLTNLLKDRKQLEIVGGKEYLNTLVNMVPTAAHALHYAKIVRHKKVLRDLIDASGKIAQLGFDEKTEADELVDEAEQKIFSISQKTVSRKFTPIKDSLSEAFERIDKLHKGDGTLRGVLSGFYDLDNLLSGFQASDLIILAARPSIGKTGMALNFALNAANKGIPVGIFSIEMSKEQVVDRLISSRANIDLWKMRTGHLNNEDFEYIQHALNELSETPIYIDDTPSPTILQMRTMARRLQAEQKLGLIIIDYLQLVQPRTSIDSPVQQVTEISRGLKSLARELNIPVIALSQLSRAVESRMPPIPKLSDLRESGCLTGDSLIVCADTGRRIPIKKLVKRKKPLRVLSLNDRYQLTPRLMTKAFYSGRKMTYELRTLSGRKIKASGNHPFLKLRGWTKLEELKKGDAIALPRQLNIKTQNSVSKNELILLAHLLGDGCILPNQPFHYTSADMENIKTVGKAAKKLFGIKPRIVKQKNWYHIYLPSPYHLTRGKYHPITNWFKKLGIELVHSWEKQVPEIIFQYDKKNIALFLKHLWATDGNLSWKNLKGRKPAGSIYYATSSPAMAEQIQHLLLRLDIQGSLKKVDSKKNYRAMYHIYVQGAQNQLRFLSVVGIADRRRKIIPSLTKALKEIIPNPNNDIIPREAWKEIIQSAKERIGMSWRALSQGINVAYCGSTLFKSGISRERMMRIHTVLNDQRTLDMATSDIFWDKIVEVKKLGMEDVYDATIEKTHNFIANDIIVHNSLEQDADVVMFIYRADKYQKEVEPDKQNIAEIHIAKHRNGPTGKINLHFSEEIASFENLDTQHNSKELPY